MWSMLERSNRWTLCASAHPRVQARPDAFPKPFPHPLQNLGAHTTASHCNSRDFPRDVSSQRSALIKISWTLQRIVHGYDWVFEVLIPQLQPCLFPSLNNVFASWTIVFLFPVLGCLHCPKAFAFCPSLCFVSCCPAHLSPTLLLQFPCKLLGRKHASPHQPEAAPICRPLDVVNVDAGLQCSNFLSSQC